MEYLQSKQCVSSCLWLNVHLHYPWPLDVILGPQVKRPNFMKNNIRNHTTKDGWENIFLICMCEAFSFSYRFQYWFSLKYRERKLWLGWNDALSHSALGSQARWYWQQPLLETQGKAQIDEAGEWLPVRVLVISYLVVSVGTVRASASSSFLEKFISKCNNHYTQWALV